MLSASFLPVAVEAIIAVIEAAAAIMTPVRNAENAIDGADRTSDTRSDSAANDAADRSGNPVTFGSSILGSANDALGMSELRDRQPCEYQSRDRQL